MHMITKRFKIPQLFWFLVDAAYDSPTTKRAQRFFKEKLERTITERKEGSSPVKSSNADKDFLQRLLFEKVNILSIIP